MAGSALQVTAVSEIGLCKRENQDRILARIGEGPWGDFGLFVIADGMGGQAGGGLAAEIAIRICEDWWHGIMPRLMTADGDGTLRRVVLSLKEAAHHLNDAVIGLGGQLGSAPGTTLSALFIFGGGYGYVHLGDSRIYHVDNCLEQLTLDDTWVAHQVRAGSLSAAQAEQHPQKHVLTQCAGSAENIHVHQGMGTISGDSGFILCSDGFYHHLTPEELVVLPEPKHDMDAALSLAVKHIHARGATDNLSAIIVSIQDIARKDLHHGAAGAIRRKIQNT